MWPTLSRIFYPYTEERMPGTYAICPLVPPPLPPQLTLKRGRMRMQILAFGGVPWRARERENFSEHPAFSRREGGERGFAF
jgi:hypothetical protein